MKIIFDNIIFALQKSGGISIVWYELLKRFMRDKKEFFFIDYENDNIFNSKLHLDKRNIIDSPKRSILLERYSNLKLSSVNAPFIFHSSYYRTTSNPHAINITTVHDFTYEHYNHGIRKFIHSWQKKKAVLKSDYIICISENTKKDLLHFIPQVNPNKIRIVYNGVSDEYFLLPKDNMADIPYEAQTYVVFVGSRAKYKNFELTVKAISQSQLNLVIVGAPLNENEKELIKRHFTSPQKVYCTGYIDNTKLNVLYNNAYALLYPSVYEGFGIPVLEAQKAGCPVIAYNGSSIPEVIGDPTLLINESSVTEIQRCLSILSDEKRRSDIIAKGLDNAKRFSWNKMYESILAIYQEAWNSIKK